MVRQAQNMGIPESQTFPSAGVHSVYLRWNLPCSRCCGGSGMRSCSTSRAHTTVPRTSWQLYALLFKFIL